MAVERGHERLMRATGALQDAGIPYAVVGVHAVAEWVARKDPDAVRTTKDVDLLLERADLDRAERAMATAGFEYAVVHGVGMFLDRDDPSPKRGVHLVWAGEKVKAWEAHPAPEIASRQLGTEGFYVVDLIDLMHMKLMAHRDHDRTHLRDMIDVGLIDRDTLGELPADLAERLEPLLVEMGR